jgi:beta-glucanase (GH16 family)
VTASAFTRPLLSLLPALLAVIGTTGCGASYVQAVRGADPIRAVAAPSAIHDSQGQRWAGEKSSDVVGWSGGRTVCSMGRVAGTASQALYQCARMGVARVAVSVPPGVYGVTLSFVETLGANPSERVFDVRAEGRTGVKALDISRVAGHRRVHHELLVVRVRDRTLNLAFIARRGQPLLNAVEVARLKTSPSPRAVEWSDEFGGPAGQRVDRRKWKHEVGAGGWGSHELQRFTRSTANAATDGHGRLAIVARRHGAAGDSYTSARLTTSGRFAFRYGDVEARIRVPAGQGLWPGFWALGNDIDRKGWPRSGEIDIMEVIGSNSRKTHGSIHGPTPDGEEYRISGEATHRPPLSRGFHIYGIRWLPDAMQFKLDGRAYESIARADLPADRRWVFNRPFFLLLSLAVGGDWPGPPGSGTPFPATMLVDWVRLTR